MWAVVVLRCIKGVSLVYLCQWCWSDDWEDSQFYNIL